jgi:serralysin
LPPETDITRFSVMSYNEPKNVTVNSGGYLVPVNPQTFMVYDLEALQYLYGANKTTAANQMVSFADNFVGMKTIWSPNGATINLTSSTKSNLIDLRQGAYSSINMITPPNQTTYDGKNNVGIAYGSIVDSVIGGSGDDIIYANADGDIIDGGAGANTVYLPGSQSDWTITTGANGVKQATHKATNKVTTLTNIQTITYYVPDNTALTHA